MYVEIFIRIIASFTWAFLIAVFAIPSIIQVAHKKRLLDEPNTRTVHEMLTPRLGGLAIFAGFISALTIFGGVDFGIQNLLAGCVLIFFVGLKDDIVSVSAFKKFLVQLLGTCIIILMADIRITNFQGILGIYELNEKFSYAFTFVTVVGITNAFNLIDGLDGLAGSVIMVACMVFGVYFAIAGEGTDYFRYCFVAFSLLGSVLGFLRYNFYKAKIFMGDTGSLVCGFIVAVLAIQFIEMGKITGIPNAPALAVAILLIPLLDTSRVFIVRILAGRSPFAPDKNHIHHRLIALGFTQMATVLILVIINLVAVALCISLAKLAVTYMILLLVAYAGLITVTIDISLSLKKRAELKK
ncbi:MAG: undecaprenyl/decaprenyl-phosphate alpha-N-acetylglucosaminyl 1-phosphate transferase [Cytophagaceae bacterium]|jgi:UDP-N-acetylmuramyl pentapeptide phosphotransferase/UDP-N-acetylglucosamine-1-phosphate transferase|nr:undecaprenyl/decaprenyl-phosphate alpha-N-acetylglucosaminyl 1-phosphate transferase [Cytophagaceae bacterium]